MLKPKGQLCLNYKKRQFRYFLIACKNTNISDLKIQMIAEAIEKTNTLRVIFQCFAYDNLAMFMTFNDFSIENSIENKIFYDYILEKTRESRSFHKEKRVYVEFDLKDFDKNILSQCALYLNFYEEGDIFEIEANDIYVCDNHLSLKGVLAPYSIRYCNMFDTYGIFSNEEGDEIFLRFPHSKILTSVLTGNYSFLLYDFLKKIPDTDCTLVLNPSNNESRDKVKIIKNKENILEKEPYNKSIDTYFIRKDFNYREFYATINLKFLEPFKNYEEDFDMYCRYNFLIPTTPSSNLPIIHRYCGGFYIFVQDRRVMFERKFEENF